MPRKKVLRRRSKNNSSANIHRMEKDFLRLPSKLSALLAKDMNSLKQKESKLKKALSKSNDKIKKSENRVKSFADITMTTTAKKQANKVKKMYAKLVKAHFMLDKQLSETSKALETCTNHHAKLGALKKCLNQFEKDWHKSPKPVQAKSKIKKEKPISKKDSSVGTTTQPQPQPQIFETALDNLALNEKTEMTS